MDSDTKFFKKPSLPSLLHNQQTFYVNCKMAFQSITRNMIGAPDFSLLSTLGPGCIVKKVTPVFKDGYVYVRYITYFDLFG